MAAGNSKIVWRRMAMTRSLQTPERSCSSGCRGDCRFIMPDMNAFQFNDIITGIE